MPAPRFIQIHALQHYTGTLLNRDDSGLAKTMPYGGVPRTRISSQCLKRHWRKAEGEYALTGIAPDPVRTKELADLSIMKNVRESIPDLDVEDAKQVLEALNIGLYGDKGNDANSRQPLLFGQNEINFLSSKTTAILLENNSAAEAVEQVKQMLERKSEGENFQAFRQSHAMPAGIIGAMFGRMMTSDPSANIDAAVHVAHAFTTHGEEKEIDYFTAMEELSGEPGAGHIGDTEINSGIYYVYVCVDMRELTANTTGCTPDAWLDSDRQTAAEAISKLAGLVATVSPGAKKGSTAPYGYAKAMLVEAGERQPRSLSGAYRTPSKPDFHDAVRRLNMEVDCHDQVYGSHEARRMLVNLDVEPDCTLDDVTNWLRASVLAGDAQ